MMYSRFVFRSIQPSMMVNRFLSFSRVQSAAATKLKEKPSTNDKDDKPIEHQQPIPSPSTGLTDPNKTYSEKIQRLVGEISKLSLVDVMDLNELLKVNRLVERLSRSFECLENSENSRCSHHGFRTCCCECTSTGRITDDFAGDVYRVDFVEKRRR